MITYTGKEFDPMNPDAGEIDIKDIAHALSLICRANGHFKYFYSVAQHSINCYVEAKARGYSERVQLACLLHDASEAYISDLIRPIKEQFEKYIECENKLQGLIYKKYGLDDLSCEEKNKIKLVDDNILFNEFPKINNVRFDEEIPKLYGECDFTEKDYKKIEKDFLRIFRNSKFAN